MTHYDIHYNTNEPNAKAKAISDIIDYMGQARFDDITTEFRKHKLTEDGLAMYASLCGVQGFPVKAWHEYCYGGKS